MKPKPFVLTEAFIDEQLEWGKRSKNDLLRKAAEQLKAEFQEQKKKESEKWAS